MIDDTYEIQAEKTQIRLHWAVQPPSEELERVREAIRERRRLHAQVTQFCERLTVRKRIRLASGNVRPLISKDEERWLEEVLLMADEDLKAQLWQALDQPPVVKEQPQPVQIVERRRPGDMITMMATLQALNYFSQQNFDRALNSFSPPHHHRH